MAAASAVSGCGRRNPVRCSAWSIASSQPAIRALRCCATRCGTCMTVDANNGAGVLLGRNPKPEELANGKYDASSLRCVRG